jgi:C-22 sterol desaturase
MNIGAMIIPSVYPALRDPEIYENPDYYDPERYFSGDAEVKGAKNFLVFGTGPHYCLGQTYAQNNLALMIGKAAMYLDWVHHPTARSEEIKVFATIFPMVSRREAEVCCILLTCIRMTVR